MTINRIGSGLTLFLIFAEIVMCLPIFGLMINLFSGFGVLTLLFFLHVIGLTLTFLGSDRNKSYAGNIIGVIASILGVIPFVAMALHFITACVLIVEKLKRG